MKIVAGLGSIDEYIPYVKAGADELFCGYVPESWALKYGMITPLNRREVMYYNVQIGSKSELEILAKMKAKYKIPVTMTFNSLLYGKIQYPEVIQIIEECVNLGFDSFIVADMALLYYLKKYKPELHKKIKIHISGETAEVNHLMIQEMKSYKIKRVIFHRKNTLSDMKKCIQYDRQMQQEENCLEYEAFVLNEMCHYTGAFCNSLHCDELAHICHLPYKLSCLSGTIEKKYQELLEESEEAVPEEYTTGQTGCALCALWDMKEAGITHLKLVSRGNYIDDTEKDIRQLRRAIEILKDTKGKQEYIEKMKCQLFSKGCSGNCYYL